MKKYLFLTSLLFVFPSSVVAAEYSIDPDHTKLAFKIRHLGISWVPGTFSKLSGSFTFDKSKIEASKAEATIDVSSIDTENKKRDDHLRSDDFFAVPKFPEMKFISKEVRAVKGSKFEVVGDLTMHGVTKSLVLDAEFTGAATDPWGKERVAFSASTKLNRKDFGLEWSKVLEAGALVVGEEVVISLDAEGVKKP
jgi:polyisoprenoid-binding protein YceI